MAWFLTLQGPPAGTGQSPTYELQESADIGWLSQEMANAAPTNAIVAIPVIFTASRQQVNVYVRPAAWGAWAFYQMTEEERREMLASNPLINALAQAQAAKQQTRPQSPQGPLGPAVIPRLE